MAVVLITGLVCDNLHAGLSTLSRGPRCMENTLLAWSANDGVYPLTSRWYNTGGLNRKFSTLIFFSRGRRLRGSRSARRPAEQFLEPLSFVLENSLWRLQLSISHVGGSKGQQKLGLLSAWGRLCRAPLTIASCQPWSSPESGPRGMRSWYGYISQLICFRPDHDRLIATWVPYITFLQSHVRRLDAAPLIEYWSPHPQSALGKLRGCRMIWGWSIGISRYIRYDIHWPMEYTCDKYTQIDIAKQKSWDIRSDSG